MKTVFIPFPKNEKITQHLANILDCPIEFMSHRKFPDEESYVRFEGPVKDRNFIIVCSLDRPDEKFLSLSFLCSVLKELGAKRVGLIAPYLAYMRQDKIFHTGEALSSKYFAKLLSQHIDWLVTVDPHLHRFKSLREIYSVPTCVVHASSVLSDWVRNNAPRSILIGPDEESEQWVSAVAKNAGVPFTVLKKNRKGDKEVEISLPDIEKSSPLKPILLDDIVSSGRTMIETIQHLKKLNLKAPSCLVVHPIFAGNSYEELKMSGADQIISCNTIEHLSNGSDLAPLILKACLEQDFI